VLTENGLTVDQDAIDNVLAHADVVTIGFAALAPRLLIDARANDNDGPMVALAEPVGSLPERYLWLGRRRPMFGAPEKFSFFVWPHTVRLLQERDTLAVIRRRLELLPGDGAAQLDTVLDEFRELEREEFRKAIRGEEPWKTVWAA
jgi:hypothetical protein